MKNKFIFCLIILTLFLSISAISASENVTDVVLSEENITVDDENVIDDVNKSVSEIYGDDIESSYNVSTKFTVKLTSNGTALTNKTVKIVLNNITYSKTTNAKGIASITFKLKKGNYTANYFFEGDENYSASNGTSTIFISPKTATYLKVADKQISYREGLKSIFQVKLVDINNKAVAGKYVYFKVNGKTYKVKTDSKGYATTYLSLKKGTRTVSYSFSGTASYVSCNGSFKIVVKPKLDKGYGYWVNKWTMYKVNLNKLSKLGTKHIFLTHAAFSKYGETKVLKWIQKAHKYGIKVHIWISVFYKNGKFIHPVTKKGVYNYKYMTSIIKQVKHYASLKGVDGIHFDYIRFGGNAYKYKNAVASVNYFVKNASATIRSVSANCIISAAVMPEPNDMKYYYAQDVPTMSKYLDVVVPMIYKGNYHASSKWIKKVTSQFVKKTNGAQIWSGLQTYKSDWNIKKLSYKELLKDAKNAKKGGASGIVLFRWGLSQFLNFNKL